MRLSTGLVAAVLTVSPVADAQKSQAGKRVGVDVAASEADHGRTVKVAPGEEFLVALKVRPGSDCCWRVLQFDSAVLHGLEDPEVTFEAKTEPNAVGFFSRETFRFRVMRRGETGLAFGFFNPCGRTPPEKQVRIIIRTA